MSDIKPQTTPTPPPVVAAISFTDKNKFLIWATSSTTIMGVTTLLGILGAVVQGTMAWQNAIVPAVMAAVGALWPQLQAPPK